MRTELDVVVIGGGVQGLLILDALVTNGYACALVTDGDLGDGQTLHSHGFLNTGFGMLGEQLPRASNELVQPWLRQHGIDPTGEWALIAPPGFPGVDDLPAASLPAGFNPSMSTMAVSTPDRNFPKRAVVEAMSRLHMDRIVRGTARLEADLPNIQRVAVDLAFGDETVLATKSVVIAAGCGTKQLLRDLVGASSQVEQIKHRRVHMICVRAPRWSLPAVSVAAMPMGLMLAAHAQRDHVTWYVTPMEFGGPSYDDVPRDASSNPDPGMITRGYRSLLELYPPLAQSDGVVIGCYAGYRQDVGDLPGVAMCDVVAGTDNVIVALPSGLVTPWLHVDRVCAILSQRIDPAGHQPDLQGAGNGVRVGAVVEDKPGFKWSTLDDFARLYGSE